MKLTQRICAMLMIAAIAPLCHASDANHTLTITLHNDSKQTLKFTHVTNQNSGNTYSVDSKQILPGSTAIITATTTPEDDLAGIMHFRDAEGGDNMFTILDQLKFHEGQPVFAFNKDKLASNVQSRTMGGGGPRGLNYVAADVEVTDNARS